MPKIISNTSPLVYLYRVDGLGPGELSAMALSLEHPEHVVVLDDLSARRTAQAAGLTVWGTLKILLEAKSESIISEVAPVVDRLAESGMWVSAEVKKRILTLAGEEGSEKKSSDEEETPSGG